MIRGLLLVVERDLVLHVRDRGKLLAGVAQVGFLLLVFGVAFDGMVGDVGGVSMRVFVFPGIACMNVVLTAFSHGVSLAWDRRYGFIRELLVAPLPRWVLPAAKTLSSAAVGFAHVVALLPVAVLLGVPITWPRAVAALGAGALLCLAFGALGVVLSVVVSRPETVQAVMAVAMTPLFLLSGSVFRPDRVPEWLGALVRANPMTYAVDLSRTAMLGDSVPTVVAWPVSVLALALLTAVSFAVMAGRASALADSG